MIAEDRRRAIPPPIRVLHLEDSALDGELVREFLIADGVECVIHRVWTGPDFTAAVASGDYDLILADHSLPSFDGDAALEIAHRDAPFVPFIYVSGTLGEEVAVEALKRGATDYVVKQRLQRLPAVVRRAVAESSKRNELRVAEAALRASESNFSTLVNAMPQLCWMARPDGRVVWYNQRWYDYTGTTPETMDEWGWQPTGDPVLFAEMRNRWHRSVASGASFEMTYPLRGADGCARAFLTRAHPVADDYGRIVRWIGTHTDVSAQKAAEEALRRLNETLEHRIVEAVTEREAMLAKLHDSQRLDTIGQLTGGVAHDFNNLLTPIIGNLELLLRRTGNDERAQRLIGNAMQGADRAKTLVQRLLAFARRQVLEARAIDVADLIEHMRELIVHSVGADTRLRIVVADGVPSARVDPNQLELAILNLAVNARDAISGAGSVRIEVDQQAVGAGHASGLRHGHYVRISVSDTGTGMDAATLKRAIEPFFSTKEVGKGTGLGLSMVHGLAAQLGGGLLLSSTPGKGTRAEIWLPAAFEKADERFAASASLGAMRPAVILLVEDEALVRAATSAMLADLGHDVVPAASAAAALELLRTGPIPDLVITDYLMPVMNGAELAREIRAISPDIPILLATGFANLAGDATADLPLLPKPFRQSELAATIQRLVRAASPAVSC